MGEPVFQRVAIIGPGLLGGSLAMALRAWNADQSLSFAVRREEQATELGEALPGVDVFLQPGQAVRDADLVVLCTPIGTMKSLVKTLLPFLKPEAVVTDVGSVKGPVDAELGPLLKERWLGSHPMAGGEQAGFKAARANLFEQAVTILTPTATTAPDLEEKLSAFWQSVGCRIVTCDPIRHDLLMASISHLPHLVAAALVTNACPDSLPLAGNGFRDTTRIASGPADMWREILLWNREALGEKLDSLIATLQATRAQLATGDEKGLQELLAKANDIRSSLPPSTTPRS